MTKQQRSLVRIWIAYIGCLLLIVGVEVTGHENWIKPILLMCAVAAVLFTRRDPLVEPPLARWERIVGKYAFAKIWLVACVLFILTYFLVAINSSVRLLDKGGFSGLFMAFFVPILPIILIGEYEKFKAAGYDDSWPGK